MNETPTNYTEAAELLSENWRNTQSRRIAHNTYLERTGEDEVSVRLHSTYIVRFRADGTTRLDSGGWLTVTTKERMNRYLPAGFRIAATRRVWFLYFLGERVGEYTDGLVVGPREATA